MNRPLHIETDKRGVCTLTLNKPERHNAFDAELIQRLLTDLQLVDEDPSVRILILTGEGKSFCSGADLEWMRASITYDEVTNREDSERMAELMRTLYELSKPTIARVNGPAYGGGLGLIACCDIAIASKAATFAFAETKLGLVPAVIAPYILMAIGPRQARRLFLTAQTFYTTEALRFGLLHRVVEENDLDEAIAKEVKKLLRSGPEASKACKELIQHLSLSDQNLDAELAALIAALRVSPEGQAGLSAFLDKRKPPWDGD